MEAQPWRLFSYEVLLNLSHMEVFTMRRGENDRLELTCSTPYKLSQKDSAYFLKELLRQSEKSLGYEPISIPFDDRSLEPIFLLGKTERSKVYAAAEKDEDPETCAKVIDLSSPRAEAAASRELNALKAVQESSHTGKEVLPQLLGTGSLTMHAKLHRTIASKPIVKELLYLEKSCLLDILDGLFALHKAGFVHYDIRFRHMGKIAGSKRNFGRLIDLSCGREIGSSYSRDDYSGTLAHASTSVLKALAAKQEIAVDGAHDLESFVKTAMCERCAEIKQQLETIQERSENLGYLHDFWQNIEDAMPGKSQWKLLLEGARNRDYEVLREWILLNCFDLEDMVPSSAGRGTTTKDEEKGEDIAPQSSTVGPSKDAGSEQRPCKRSVSDEDDRISKRLK